MKTKHISASDKKTVLFPALRLTVITGTEKGRMFPVSKFPCVLGRGEDCNIVFTDPDNPPGISRRHATITTRDQEMLITDHSMNGTLVDSIYLSRGETGLLCNESVIQLGPSLRLRLLRETCSVSHFTGGKEYAIATPWNLREYLTDIDTLESAWRRVQLNRGAAGIDNISIQEFALTTKRRLNDLREALICGKYEPIPPRLFAAPKRNGGVRVIAILSIRDRIVQQALRMTLQPILEPLFPPCSYAYRTGVCAHDALRKVEAELSEGLTWISETDIQAFFDNISHSILLSKLGEQVSDPFTLTLITRFLSAGSSTPGIGIPQGAATSPLFSNLYLAEFDALMMRIGGNPVRYGDDMIFLSRTKEKAQSLLAEANGWLTSKLALSLNPDKTAVTHIAKGFTFLGFHYTASGRRPSPQAIADMEERLSKASPTSTLSMLRGWKNYFHDITGLNTTTVSIDDTAIRSVPAMHGNNELNEDALISKGCLYGMSVTEKQLEKIVALFGGREDAYACLSQSGGKLVFAPSSGGITAEMVGDHLAGKKTYAGYLIRLDGMVRTLVIDVDIINASLHFSSVAKTESPLFSNRVEDDSPSRTRLDEFVENMRRTCKSFGIPVSIEDSGRKGCHLWFFFSEPVPPDMARRFGRLLASHAGFPMPELRIEIFPRHSKWYGPELGDAVKLPFGVHPVTGRRCFLLDAENNPMVDLPHVLDNIQFLSSKDIEKAIEALSVPSRNGTPSVNMTHHAKEIQTLVKRCSVIRALVAKAYDFAHLRHTHNLILLYTVGRLGEEGARFIHQTLSLCTNYNSEICRRYIDRLDETRLPITCGRIREWLEEEDEVKLCSCEEKPHSPLDFVGGEKTDLGKSKTEPVQPTESTFDDEQASLWEKVSTDLFSSPSEDEGSSFEMEE